MKWIRNRSTDISMLVGVCLLIGWQAYEYKKVASERQAIARELVRLEQEYDRQTGEWKFHAWKQWGHYLVAHQEDKNRPKSIVDSAKRWRVVWNEYYPPDHPLRAEAEADLQAKQEPRIPSTTTAR
jgi:hypothetical protein